MPFLKSLISLSIIALLLSACTAKKSSLDSAVDAITPPPPTLTPGWLLSGLDSPESVVPSTDGSFLYVSNVNGDGTAKDGNGYISKVSTEGKLLEQYWVIGLNAPKGLALLNSVLYVADIDELILIDTNSGEVLSRTAAPDAKFLNDVAVTNVGILISDSANARLYRYQNNTMSIWMEDSRLEGINGLLSQDDRLLITTMSNGELLSLDWITKDLTVLAANMINADGLSQLADGSFIVSSWPGKLYHVFSGSEPSLLLDTEATPINMNDIYLLGDTLIAPNWRPGTLRTFTVTQTAQ